MRPAIRFVVALVLGLGVVTWIASVIVRRTTRTWFEKDLGLRAQLALSGARQGLLSHWHAEDRSRLTALLGEMTRDERIMAAAACTADLRLLTRTHDYPSEFSCESVGVHVRPSADAPSRVGPSGRT